MLDSVVKDLKLAFRLLLKNPLFTLAAVLSLALGIGANAVIFTVMNSLLFRSLPVEKPKELVSLFTSDSSGSPWGSTSWPDYLDLRGQTEAFADTIAYSPTFFSMSRGGENEIVLGERVSANYFTMLGVDAVHGRVFTSTDSADRGSPLVAVISHRLWQRRFQGDPRVLDEEVKLNGQPVTFIGVAPEGFHDTFVGVSIDVWVPMLPSARLGANEAELDSRDQRGLFVLGRLAPGAGVDQARAQLRTIGSRLEEEYPSTNEDRFFSALPAGKAGVHPQFNQLFLLLGLFLMVVVGIVVLIASLNIASLLLARASTRVQEIGLRLALGAPRLRLIRQLVTESLVLAILGGGLGLLLASWAMAVFTRLAPAIEIPIDIDLGLDGRVLLFTLGFTILTGLFFGLLPALQASRPDLMNAVRNEPVTLGRRFRKLGLRNLLIVAQVAVSLLLLIGAALFLRSLGVAERIDPGFETENTLLVPLNLGVQGYSEERGRDFYQRISERLAATPSVRSVGLAEAVPLGLDRNNSFVMVPGDRSTAGEISFNVVGEGYFRMMGIGSLRGRDFDSRDHSDAATVAVVNRTMAERLWPGGEAVGQSFATHFADDAPTIEVVGVVEDSKYHTLGEGPTPHFYLALSQNYEDEMFLHVRTSGDALDLVETVRGEIRALDENLPIPDIKTLDDQTAFALLPARLGGAAFGVFGLLALVLAAMGIYGVMAIAVSQRTREIGIRMSLGADRKQVLGLVVKEAMILVAVGCALGILGALVVMRLVLSLLYGVSAADPVSFAVVALLMAAVAFVASLVPALRATRIDPVNALRYE